MSFDTWWFKNKELYTLAGVSEAAARCIWTEAVYSVEIPLGKEIENLIKSLQEES